MATTPGSNTVSIPNQKQKSKDTMGTNKKRVPPGIDSQKQKAIDMSQKLGGQKILKPSDALERFYAS